MSIVKAIYFMVPADEVEANGTPVFSRQLALDCLQVIKDKGHPVVEIPVPREQFGRGTAYTRVFLHAAKAGAVLRNVEPGTDEAILCGYIMNDAYEMIQGNKVPGFLPESEGMRQLERTAREMMRPRPLLRSRPRHNQSNVDWQSRNPAGVVYTRPTVEIKPSYPLSDFQRKHVQSVLAGAGFDAVFKGVKDES